MKGFFNSRKFRQGTMATAITAMVIAILVAANFAATALTDKYSLILDLTPTKLFSITEETKTYLRGLDRDVVIYVLDREDNFTSNGEYYLQANEVLKKYSLETNRIQLVYKDLIADPAFAQNYPSLQLSSSTILVTCDGKARDVTPYDLYDIETDQYGYNQRVTASKAEQVLTSAVLAVSSEKTINVAVIGGHNEESISAFRSLLQSNNYLVEDVSLLTEEIDPVFSAAIIAAPVRDYEEEELKKLDRFLKNEGQYGKTLLYFSSSEQTDLPNLDAFLADWGIQVEPGIVMETDASRHYPNMPYMALLDYAEEEFSVGVINSDLIPVTAYARPVSLLFESKSTISTSTLLRFSESAGVYTESMESLGALQPSGPIPYLVMGKSLTYNGTTPLESQVIAAGSTLLIHADFISNTIVANSEYMLGLLASLTGQEEGVKIQSKSIGSETLALTANQAVWIGIVLALVLPLVVLIFGITVWARRRHL